MTSCIEEGGTVSNINDDLMNLINDNCLVL